MGHFFAFRVGNRPGGCPFGRRKWAEWPAALAYAGALSIFVPARRFPGPVAAAGNEKGIPCESVTIPVAVCSGPAASKLRGIGRPLCATGSAESGRRRSWSESEDLPPCLCELCFYGEWKDSAAADLPPPFSLDGQPVCRFVPAVLRLVGVPGGVAPCPCGA